MTNPYKSLSDVLDEALLQASDGKGAARHSSGEPFEEQPICLISRDVGLGFALGQAMKKILESQRLPGEAGAKELLGAINYLAAAIIVRREQYDNQFQPIFGQSVCPNCEAPYLNDGGGIISLTGDKKCVKCGKQFS